MYPLYYLRSITFFLDFTHIFHADAYAFRGACRTYHLNAADGFWCYRFKKYIETYDFVIFNDSFM